MNELIPHRKPPVEALLVVFSRSLTQAEASALSDAVLELQLPEDTTMRIDARSASGSPLQDLWWWMSQYTSKHGFDSGDEVPSAAYGSRETIVPLLNKHFGWDNRGNCAGMGVRAMAYSPLSHNECQIVFYVPTIVGGSADTNQLAPYVPSVSADTTEISVEIEDSLDGYSLQVTVWEHAPSLHTADQLTAEIRRAIESAYEEFGWVDIGLDID